MLVICCSNLYVPLLVVYFKTKSIINKTAKHNTNMSIYIENCDSKAFTHKKVALTRNALKMII